jgi:hypothetical protein
MRLRMGAMAAVIAAAVGMFGGSPASAVPASGPAIGAAATAGHEVEQVRYWRHHYYWRRHWGYRHYYWRHRHWRRW